MVLERQAEVVEFGGSNGATFCPAQPVPSRPAANSVGRPYKHMRCEVC